MAHPSGHTPDDFDGRLAKMNEQISSILAGFGAYSTTMKHHSLLFMRQQEAFDELKASNDRKDTKIAELENSTAGTTIIIEEQQATIARMATTIKDLERKIEKKPSLTGEITEMKTRTRAAAREQMTKKEKQEADQDLIQEARNGRLTDVQRLLAAGADPDAGNDEDITALMKAAENGHLQIVEVLLANKATINAADDDGDTALIFASSQGHAQIVEVLLDNGANVNAASKDGRTALMKASGAGNLQILQVLLANGANIDAAESDGWTTLIWAYNQPHILEELIEKGASLNLKDENGRTALGRAEQNGRQACMAILKAAGAIG